MATWTGVITNAGNELLKKWAVGGVLKFERAALGSGKVGEAEMLEQTALLQEMQSAAILGAEETDVGIRLHLQITGADVSYEAEQYGIWASIDGDATAMLALFQRSEGLLIPSKDDVPDYSYTLIATLLTSNQGQFEVVIGPAIMATVKYVNEELAKLVHLYTIEIPTTGWNTADAGYYFDIEIQHVKESQYPIMTLHPESLPVASAAGMSQVGQTNDGFIRIWASKIPDSTMSMDIALLAKNENATDTIDGDVFVMPVATETSIGGVKIGQNITVTEDGTISTTSASNDHKLLDNRDAADQHPIEAISGLERITDEEIQKIWDGQP